jgi:hypothetical protein
MLTSYALKKSAEDTNNLQQFNGNDDEKSITQPPITEDNDIIRISLSGEYEFAVTSDIIDKMKNECCVDVTWSYNDVKKYDNDKFKLKKQLVRVIYTDD